MQPKSQRKGKKGKKIKNNLNLTKRKMIKNTKMIKAYLNWYQMEEEITRMKITGSDLQDDLSQKFWAWEDEEEGEGATVALSLQSFVMGLGLIPA